MVILINSVIGGSSRVDLVKLYASTLPLQVSDNGQLSVHNYTWLVKNKAAKAPVTFEEIVMVMINSVVTQRRLWGELAVVNSFK